MIRDLWDLMLFRRQHRVLREDRQRLGVEGLVGSEWGSRGFPVRKNRSNTKQMRWLVGGGAEAAERTTRTRGSSLGDPVARLVTAGMSLVPLFQTVYVMIRRARHSPADDVRRCAGEDGDSPG